MDELTGLVSKLEEINGLLNFQNSEYLKKMSVSLSDQVNRLRFLRFNSANSKVLVESLQRILDSLKRNYIDRSFLEAELKNSEYCLAYLLFPTLMSNVIEAAMKNLQFNYSNFDEFLPNLVYEIFMNRDDMPQSIEFNNFVSYMGNAFQEIGFKYCKTFENTLKNLLVESLVEPNPSFAVHDTQKVFEKIYGKFSEYLRLKRICEYSAKNQEFSPIMFGLVIIPTSIPSKFKGTGFIEIGQIFNVDCFGVPGSKRYCEDQMVVFGRVDNEEDLVDIPLPPNDFSKSHLHAIIYLKPEAIYIQDTSDIGRVGIKLMSDENLKLQSGMLIMFSNCIVTKVEKIDLTVNENSQLPDEDDIEDTQAQFSSILYLKYLTGPLKDTTTRLKSDEKHTFAVGCGGNGNVPDLFLPRDTGVSRLHSTLTYSPQDGTWRLKDEGSTNGTFFLLKSHQQYETKEPSELYPIYSQNPLELHGLSFEKFRVFNFGDYSFLLRPN